MHLVAAVLLPLEAVCVKGHTAEYGGEWLLQLQLGLIHLLRPTPGAESFDLHMNNTHSGTTKIQTFDI